MKNETSSSNIGENTAETTQSVVRATVHSPLRVVIGIDPGIGGGVAVMADGEVDRMFSMPRKRATDKREEIDARALAFELKLIREGNAGAHISAVVEQVASMPKNGVASMFNFGETLGVIKGVLAGLNIPKTMVRPVAWKKHYGMLGTEKDFARRYAMQRWPAWSSDMMQVKDNGKSDALLLANWGFETESWDGADL
jgi:crossover junction endodeoxyribonuclease RuvC